MIKAFIVVNNHAMVRLCRFYEQLVRVFTPSHSDERNFFFVLALFSTTRENFYINIEKATDTRAYTCKSLMNPPPL